MNAVEFTTQLTEQSVISIPREAAGKLPSKGWARVIVLTGDDSDASDWREGAYEQFLREDPPEDSIYDNVN